MLDKQVLENFFFLSPVSLVRSGNEHFCKERLWVGIVRKWWNGMDVVLFPNGAVVLGIVDEDIHCGNRAFD